MSEISNGINNENNQVYIQADLADKALDKAEVEEAKKLALEFQTKIHLQNVIDIEGDGDGRSRDARLLNIYASHAIRG